MAIVHASIGGLLAQELKAVAQGTSSFSFSNSSAINSFLSSAQTTLVSNGTLTSTQASNINTSSGAQIAAAVSSISAATSTSFVIANVGVSVNGIDFDNVTTSLSTSSAVSASLPELTLDQPTPAVSSGASVSLPEIVFDPLSVSVVNTIGVSIPELHTDAPTCTFDIGEYCDGDYVIHDYVEGNIPQALNVSLTKSSPDLSLNAPTATVSFGASIAPAAVPEITFDDLTHKLDILAHVTIPEIALEAPTAQLGIGISYQTSVPEISLNEPAANATVSVHFTGDDVTPAQADRSVTVSIPDISMSFMASEESLVRTAAVFVSVDPLSLIVPSVGQMVGQGVAIITDDLSVVVENPSFSLAVNSSVTVSVSAEIVIEPMTATAGTPINVTASMEAVALEPAVSTVLAGASIAHVALLNVATEPPTATPSSSISFNGPLPFLSFDLISSSALPSALGSASISEVGFDIPSGSISASAVASATIPALGFADLSVNVAAADAAKIIQHVFGIEFDSLSVQATGNQPQSVHTNIVEQVLEGPLATVTGGVSVRVSLEGLEHGLLTVAPSAAVSIGSNLPETSLVNPSAQGFVADHSRPVLEPLVFEDLTTALSTNSYFSVSAGTITTAPVTVSVSASAVFDTSTDLNNLPAPPIVFDTLSSTAVVHKSVSASISDIALEPSLGSAKETIDATSSIALTQVPLITPVDPEVAWARRIEAQSTQQHFVSHAAIQNKPSSNLYMLWDRGDRYITIDFTESGAQSDSFTVGLYPVTLLSSSSGPTGAIVGVQTDTETHSGGDMDFDKTIMLETATQVSFDVPTVVFVSANHADNKIQINRIVSSASTTTLSKSAIEFQETNTKQIIFEGVTSSSGQWGANFFVFSKLVYTFHTYNAYWWTRVMVGPGGTYPGNYSSMQRTVTPYVETTDSTGYDNYRNTYVVPVL